MAVKNLSIDLSDVIGGLNTRDGGSIAGNEVQAGTYNVRLLKEGVKLAPGARGLSPTLQISTYSRFLESFKRANGDEFLLTCTGGKLYKINTDDEAYTQLYDFISAPVGSPQGKNKEAWGRAGHDKFWIASGEVAKYEGGTAALPVGVNEPHHSEWDNAVANAYTGGSLPDGVYGVYIGYARTVGGAIVLYGRGKSLGNVTLGTGSNTIRIQYWMARNDASDTDINTMVVWLTDAGGSTCYFYGTVAGTVGGDPVYITSSAERNDALLYSVEASDNYTPHDISLTDGEIEYLEIHDNRLWFSIGDTIYYSRQAGESYEMERFPADNYIDIDFPIKGLFSCGVHLIVNTEDGLYKIPYGDPTQTVEKISSNFFFTAPRSVDRYRDGIIGLTNAGVMYFDGTAWSENLSAKILPDIGNISLDLADHMPCGKIYRSRERNEYHLCYCYSVDSIADPVEEYAGGVRYPFIAGGVLNNLRLILDLDMLFDPSGSSIHWEVSEPSAEYMAVDSSGRLFNLQSSSIGSKTYRFDNAITYNSYVFGQAVKTDGVWTPKFYYTDGGEISRTKYWAIKYKTAQPSDLYRTFFYQVRGLIKSIAPITLTFYIDDVLATGVACPNILSVQGNGEIKKSTYTWVPGAAPPSLGWIGTPGPAGFIVYTPQAQGFGTGVFGTDTFQALNEKPMKIPLQCSMKGFMGTLEISSDITTSQQYQPTNNPFFTISTLHVLAIAQKGNLK